MAMLTLNGYPASSLGLRKPTSPRTGLHRLFAAAIVSDQFRETLLSKPDEALANGYLGQTFMLTDQEQTLIKSIRADTLTDLAQKVNRALKSV
ncbi:MAG: hypothetical protein ABI904_10190 [Chloroflexota bacterium]